MPYPLKLGRKLLSLLRETMCIPRLSSTTLKSKLRALEKAHRNLKPHLIAVGVEKEKIGPDWWRFEPDWNVG
jgi:hypothetical protein